ncbi:MAG: hypothetical protein JEZ02_21615 [Desulfatibacillum sp.]|nr:hypothetical protein [Desulfatibacillum sp.]
MQSQVKIVYCPGDSIWPAFGMADSTTGTAYISQDLPGPVRKFVLRHELFHLRDKPGHWIWREIKANAAGALHHPVGFFLCLLLSLQPYRLRYYWRRLQKGF